MFSNLFLLFAMICLAAYNSYTINYSRRPLPGFKLDVFSRYTSQRSSAIRANPSNTQRSPKRSPSVLYGGKMTMSNTQGSDLKSTDFGYVLDLFRNTPPSKLVDSAKNRFPLLSKLTSGKYARSLGAATAAFLLVRIFYQRVSVATGSAYAAELKRAQQFKEVLEMYFEAVHDILEKLSDPTLKSSSVYSLKTQLNQLDPTGVIRNFLTDRSWWKRRPDISMIVRKNSNSFQKNRSNSQISQEKQKKGDYDNDLASNSVQETISAENIMGKYKNTKEFDTLSNDSYQSIESERDKFSSAPSRRGTLLDTKSVMNRLDSFLKDCGHDKETRDLVINSLTVPISDLDKFRLSEVLERISAKIGNKLYWSGFIKNMFGQK